MPCTSYGTPQAAIHGDASTGERLVALAVLVASR